jgi:hypothetical protein
MSSSVTSYGLVPRILHIVTIDDDSLEPLLSSGDSIMIDTSQRVPVPPGIFVIWDGMGIVAKRVEHVPHSAPPKVIIRSLNSEYQTYEREVEYLRDRFQYARVVDPANTNNVISDDMTANDATSAHVVDSNGNFSDQIDVVLFDRHYSPYILNFQQQKILSAESAYAVFEAKQSINLNEVRYAQEKIASVRRLNRTKPANSVCRGNVSGKTARRYPGRHPDVRERLEPAAREGPGRRAGG